MRIEFEKTIADIVDYKIKEGKLEFTRTERHIPLHMVRQISWLLPFESPNDDSDKVDKGFIARNEYRIQDLQKYYIAELLKVIPESVGAELNTDGTKLTLAKPHVVITLEARPYDVGEASFLDGEHLYKANYYEAGICLKPRWPVKMLFRLGMKDTANSLEHVLKPRKERLFLEIPSVTITGYVNPISDKNFDEETLLEVLKTAHYAAQIDKPGLRIVLSSSGKIERKKIIPQSYNSGYTHRSSDDSNTGYSYTGSTGGLTGISMPSFTGGGGTFGGGGASGSW